MEVERLTAVLEASGLGTFNAQMAAADRATEGTKDQLRALAEVSRIATEALSRVKMTASQAVESRASAEAILQGVRGVSEEARHAARELDRVKLSQAQAAETRIAAEEEVRSLKQVEHQALRTRAATGGGGRGGGAGMGLLAAGIGAGVLAVPAAGPGALGLLAAIPTFAASGVGALGTLALAFQGVGKAIMGNKKAFDGLVPEQQQFVLSIRSLSGAFRELKQIAGAALFPGLDAAIHSALSPATMNAVAQAVTAFGKAIGSAAQQWGAYFGSAQFRAIFGPLMQAGAVNLGKMSDAALRLFDAFGVLGRAAIPLVNWMVNGIDAASRWADAFTRSRNATGGLSRAMDEAKTSLQLVGNLFGALSKAVYELGAALYPVSKVAVKDLTDGLNWLANLIARNKQVIQEIVGTAFSAFVGVVKVAASAVRGLNDVLSHFVGGKSAIVTAILGIGVAMTVAFGPESVAIAGAILAVGLIRQHWQAFANWVVGIFKWIAGKIGAVFAMIPSWIDPTLHNLGKSMVGWANSTGTAIGSTLGASLSQAFQGALNLKSLAAGGFNTDLLTGKANPAALASGGALSAKQIGAMAKAHGLDPQAVLAVAKMEGLGGGIGDGGHAFGPFQLNNAGGVITNKFPGWTNAQIQKWAWSKQGVNFALQQMAQVAGGQTGYGAIASIVNGFERPKNPGAEIAGAWNAYGGTGGPFTSSNVFGTPPPFTTGLGPKPPKPPVIPASVSHLLALAGTAGANASALSNTGSIAKQYLEAQLKDLSLAYDQLRDKLAGAHGKAKTTLDTAMHNTENKIAHVLKLIADAIVVAGDALLPAKLKAKLGKLTAQAKADGDYAAVLVGQGAENYRKVTQKDLLNEAAVYQAMVASLKSKLAGASGKQKAAIQAELTKIQGSLDQVQQSILGELQKNVSYLQGKVSTYFGNVTQQFDAALGKLFYQNGAQTPLEAQLAQMQAQDQLGGLKDALQQAKDQLAQDTAGALTQVVYDMTTGKTTNVYNPAAQKQLAADQKAIDAATRQLAEYNLGIRAAQERASMDKQYATQVGALNRKLADLADAFQNGTGSMQALRDLASQYGVVINTENIPDFSNLSDASKGLKLAFIDLANYIAKITGTTPKIPDGTGGGAGGGTAPSGSPAAVLQNLHAQAVNGVLDPATYAYMLSGHKLNIPGFASGGIVRAKPGGTIVRVAEAGQDEEIGPVGGRGRGGAMTVEMHVHALDPNTVDWGAISEKIRAELLRTQKRNGGSTGIK